MDNYPSGKYLLGKELKVFNDLVNKTNNWH